MAPDPVPVPCLRWTGTFCFPPTVLEPAYDDLGRISHAHIVPKRPEHVVSELFYDTYERIEGLPGSGVACPERIRYFLISPGNFARLPNHPSTRLDAYKDDGQLPRDARLTWFRGNWVPGRILLYIHSDTFEWLPWDTTQRLRSAIELANPLPLPVTV